ncbi:NAD(P)H-quinone oxidoreductase subunit K [Striga asiatica]|uniref:NAD(P)H-quinone oxidoreductase subunit K n=1 Tax=Striga asiatica TaxID=4170 RepID=A0A5A7P5L9_STRAF|nr:NAD(P)H-quinone oxidoreductase subunit K [Striga asiatica]
MPEPKYVIAMGACTITGGMFSTDSYSTVRGVDKLIPHGPKYSGSHSRGRMNRRIQTWSFFPLMYWSNTILSRIASTIRVPKVTDGLTPQRKRISFALVEAKVFDKLPDSVELQNPINGVIFKHRFVRICVEEDLPLLTKVRVGSAPACDPALSFADLLAQ